jgi:ribosomal protein S18 acetylase RimI-like enzyme
MTAMRSDARTLPLPDGRTLTIRPVGPADVDGLAALYAGLSQDDTYRRFFSVFQPRRSFFEKMATTEERGGFGLVAAVSADSAPESELVAEAGYTRLDDGDGELAITVARGWRGWLGPYLLDALLAAGAARGVPNLQADVLVTNGPMLALLRSRGYATVDHPDGSVVRVLIGTSGRTPTWSGPADRPRVLVEAPGGRWHAEDAARQAGVQVVVCPGPGSTAAHCPALVGQPCPLAAGADAIVVSHPLHDERWSRLEAAHAELHAGVPVCVELGPRDEPRPGQRMVPRESEREVVAFVQRLISD